MRKERRAVPKGGRGDPCITAIEGPTDPSAVGCDIGPVLCQNRVVGKHHELI
jgi:hypothetical protein